MKSKKRAILLMPTYIFSVQHLTWSWFYSHAALLRYMLPIKKLEMQTFHFYKNHKTKYASLFPENETVNRLYAHIQCILKLMKV